MSSWKGGVCTGRIELGSLNRCIIAKSLIDRVLGGGRANGKLSPDSPSPCDSSNRSARTIPGGIYLSSSTPNAVLLPINAINLPHDPFSPLNGSTNQGFRPRARLGIEEILRCFQMTGNQDPGYDREHSFASFVHARQLSIFAFSSLFDSVDFDQNTRTGYRVHSRPGCRSASKYAPGRTFPRSTSARRTTTWFWSCTLPVAFKSWVPVSLSRATS